ncbi:MAG: cytochrome b/b6 domain-containing protein [Armatimonadetes bacterium]|nr:cytochrome b/b6 domain-containing protein [Armatimonadota bacterium]
MSPENNHKEQTQRYYERLSLSQRAQHIVLIISFMTLVITGLPVRYPETKAAGAVIKSMGGMAVRAGLHRVAAVILIVLCFYHVLWVLFTKRGHEEFLAFIPRKKDALDLFHQLKYYFGLSRTTPRHDRFNWIEKFEYLAMGWGSVVMILTGLLLWFENQAMLVLPLWVLDVTRVIHSFEALLAFLAIVIWHCYHVHLNPSSFPMSKVWLTGLISEEELKEHHPLEYERIRREEIPPARVEVEPTKVGSKSE